jgi:hypothetical protein
MPFNVSVARVATCPAQMGAQLGVDQWKKGSGKEIFSIKKHSQARNYVATACQEAPSVVNFITKIYCLYTAFNDNIAN